MALRFRRIGRLLISRHTLSVVAIAGFVIALIWAWVTQVAQTVQCSAVLGRLEDWGGYIQINLKHQHPTEPYFEGEIWFIYADEAKKAVSSVTITRSGGRGYGDSRRRIDTIWDEVFHGLRPKAGFVPFDVVAASGLHQYFPLDSASFDFTLDLVPLGPRRVFIISNRVPGFVLPCNKFRVSSDPKGSLHVSFTLRRSPLIQLFVFVLSLAMVIFLVLIIRIKDTGVLPTAVASYFFSVFSLRTIVGDQVKTFPTLFDCVILTVCMVMLVSLIWTVSKRW